MRHNIDMRAAFPMAFACLPGLVLVSRSRFLPRFLGVWLIINGLAYIAMSVTGTMGPHHYGKLFTLSQPALFGGVALMLWLMIKGARPPAEEVAV